ncbi:MAG: hypothetical protein P8J87_07560 [Verrucomicrobiales bacterium]|nr:hypothetical protein [Verrucomicrobiales bacterium]
MKNIAGIVVAVGFGLPALLVAEDVVVSSAAVTQVHSVDPGLKAFVLSPRAASTTVSLTPGTPVEVVDATEVGDGQERTVSVKMES